MACREDEEINQMGMTVNRLLRAAEWLSVNWSPLEYTDGAQLLSV